MCTHMRPRCERPHAPLITPRRGPSAIGSPKGCHTTYYPPGEGGRRQRSRHIAGNQVCSWDPRSDVQLAAWDQCPDQTPCSASRDFERFCISQGGFNAGQPVPEQYRVIGTYAVL